MKRLRSSDNIDSNLHRSSSSSHQSFPHQSENPRKNLMSPSSSDKRKGFDRYASSPRDAYSGGGNGSGGRSIHRSESFCIPRREFPKGFRSERDRPRREGSASSWRRFSGINRSSDGRDVLKSPSWSSSEHSMPRGGREGRSKETEKSKGRERGKERSPTWSKDSSSEQSRSLEVKKIEIRFEEDKKNEVEWKGERSVDRKKNEVESKGESGSSSEMEEGELEPEPISKLQEDAVAGVQVDQEVASVQVEQLNAAEQREELTKEAASEPKELMDDCNQVKELETGHVDASGCRDIIRTIPTVVDEQENNDDNLSESSNCKEENLEICDSKEMESVIKNSDESFHLDGNNKKKIDLEVKVEDTEMPDSYEGNTRRLVLTSDMALVNSGWNVMDKDKGVASTSSQGFDYLSGSVAIAAQVRNVVPCEDDDLQGVRPRGFELFSRSPVRRPDRVEQSLDVRQKDEKLVLEPLDLSLSLPSVLLPIGASRDANIAPSSPSHARSVQSLTSTFRTNSDALTASISFSGSQSFYHNPSCSLTNNNSLDNYEQTVHSHPIFQGIDKQSQQGTWQRQSQNDSRNKEIPLYQRVLMIGNGSIPQSQTLPVVSNDQAIQGSSMMPNGLERQLSFHKQLSGGQLKYHDGVKSPAQSVGSHEIGSNYSFEKKLLMRDKSSSSLYMKSSQKEQQQFLIGGAHFVEMIISRIVSEPVHIMARKFHEMTGQSVACLKESIHEIMVSAEKQGQLGSIHNVLQNRPDLTLDMLLKSHRTQLEILVALKTRLPEYLQLDSGISSSELADIFLNQKCRNLTCRSPLPVDECDCRICVKKHGFCSACMCLVCSKFDNASNTCSWVGCDVCLHWCHVDCALRESYIRNGQSTNGAKGTTEMQFHCVACDHPSEMFGFVKEVFQNFAKDWMVEKFCKELEYVKRIFLESKDARGKRLNVIVDQMLARLVSNTSDLPEVHNYVTSFLTESDSSNMKNTAILSHKEQERASRGAFSHKEQGKASNGIAGPSQAASAWPNSSFPEKALQLDRSASFIHSIRDDQIEKHPLELELLRSRQKEPVFDELESIVRIKQAEAKMFQARADDARREADALKRIAIAKNEKIEEEYAGRIAKLCMVDVEEIRKQKVEEFQAFERAHREYFNLKTRMEADIRDLLMEMEATKRNFAVG